MNTESIRIEFDASGHPHDTALLLALEGELSERDAARVEAHTGTCSFCQKRRAEVEIGFVVYDEYRATVFLPEFPETPHTIHEFLARLKKVSGESITDAAARLSVTNRAGKVRSWLFGKGTPIRWVRV